MLTVHEASARILSDVVPLPPERVPLLDALGRVLATAVRSPVTIPAWDNSGMDGYALRAADIADASAEHPVTLRVAETVAAGEFPSRAVEAGSATRIMTGAPIPEGADTVVRVEDTDGGVETVTVRSARDAHCNIRPRGEDVREGDEVLPAGAVLGPAQIGVLSAAGAASVDVYRRPRVAFLGSGDEVVDLDRYAEVIAGRKILSSNSYTLHTMIVTAGGTPVNLGTARDDPADLRERLTRARGADLLVTTAGVSVGAFDYTRDVLRDLGAEMRFWKVRMRPGAPIGFGMVHGAPWIGLPGNPVSTMVTFELFVRPVIRRMCGETRIFPRTVPVRLEEPVSTSSGLVHFLRAIVTPQADGTFSARLTGPQGSGILSSMAKANALIVVPEERTHNAAGDELRAILLGESAGLTDRFLS
ncbi:MAG TPA: gephyrin-like molybdotransferase Glp [Gemmatimonadaceae bacterium]|nr:gephyrin-like molybdotransferase Glp [Gemmatimonadaceae bacterium]